MKFNQEMAKTLGQAGLKIGKTIIVEGTKSVVLKTAVATITTTFDEGFGAIKDLKLDDYLRGGKEKPTKGLFNKKRKKEKDPIEEVLSEVEEG